MTIMNNNIKGIVSAVICLMIPFCLYAQGSGTFPGNGDEAQKTKITRATQIAVGGANVLDTYLSPLEYKGTDVRFISSVLRTRACEWDLQYNHEGNISFTHNPADNANTMSGHYDFAFAMMHRWELMQGKLTLRAGGLADFNIGFAYNMRNSANNPAQGYASLAIGTAGMATYNLKIGRKVYPITYDVKLPLIGMMFSPAFGQSYYEIFNQGDYDHNVQCFTVGTPSIRQQLSVDIPVSQSVAVRAGYLCDIRQATPNNLKQHTYINSFLIGFIKKLR